MRKILLVDDDPEILKLSAHYLTLGGFQVVTAVHAEAAFRLFSPSIAAVVTDLRLPGRSGLWLLKEIRKRDEAVLLVLTSGDARREEVAELARLLPVRLLRKPYRMQALLDCLEPR